jgi:hypothetical protein
MSQGSQRGRHHRPVRVAYWSLPKAVGPIGHWCGQEGEGAKELCDALGRESGSSSETPARRWHGPLARAWCRMDDPIAALGQSFRSAAEA